MSLAFSDVHKQFGRTRVIDGFNAHLDRGDRLCLVGSNGSGKTTILRMAAGLLRPTRGGVTNNGHPTITPRGRFGMAYVGQENPVYAELTVREHLRWWSRVHSADVDVNAWLDECGLRQRAEHPAVALSRGQRQRLHIGMALSIQPDVIILDEPTSALDDEGVEWLMDHLAAHPATMLAATHHPRFATRLQAGMHQMGVA